ncbi:Murein DD-endopeptidase MepH precursor [Arthrobacter ulcerisalmonis]|uniref:Murein DD-endopeptidase MepH n=1 Tax=Arthrobacter ulcerisalmonis TaxID=2483813 RepID=A0A3P5WQ44_9MICC|nr:C40 family peptidase [Arthrobacter ulcerisalmonis]VDC23725.1 Murein DD-endopeptidase MepH precursor [Arthrobacter ulcerisalmonis]
MTMTDVIGRMQGIQSMIDQLKAPIAAKSPATSASSAAGSAAFNQALTTALGGTDASAVLGGLPASLTAGTGASTSAALAVSGVAGAAGAGAAGGVNGDTVVATAKKYIGVPYVWGGTNPATGMDCSGFVQRVFKDLNIELPRVVSDQMNQGTPVASLAEAKAGDLLVSFGGEHISIYLGNGKAIDAPVPGQTIQIRDAWEQHSNLTSIRRIVPGGNGA